MHMCLMQLRPLPPPSNMYEGFNAPSACPRSFVPEKRVRTADEVAGGNKTCSCRFRQRSGS